MKIAEVAKPRGRPPKDPVKLAQYLALKAGQKISESDAKAAVEANLPPVKVETDEEIVERISHRFDMMQKIARGACEGTLRAVIVSGAGGTGKTHSLEDILEYYNEKYGKKVTIVRGMVTPINLYMLLYRNASADSILLLDDADAIFNDENALNLLKGALDTGKKRKISWMSESNALKAEDIPQTFEYEGTMIFITNINMQSYVDTGKTKLVPHMQALMTRALYLDLKLHTARELMAWVAHVVLKKHILVDHGLDYASEKSVIEWIKENQDNMRELSLRTAIKVAKIMELEPKGWRKMAEEMLCR